MKTIVQVVQHLTPGGIEVMAIELKNSMPSDAHVLIISLEGNKQDTIDAWPRFSPIAADIICLNKQEGLDSQLIVKLVNVFRGRKISAVHTHHIGPLIYAGIAARIAGIKHVVHTEHDAWHLENKKRRWLQRLILSLTRPTLIADSCMVANEMKKHLFKKNIKVIPNGIDIRRFTPGDRQHAQSFFNMHHNVHWIGASGRLEKVKGHKTLLAAMSHLPNHVHLALAGSGSQFDALCTRVHELGLNGRVHFLGHLDDMPTFYRAIDVFCLPSLHEGMPLAPLEAQACGIPAVVSETGGTKETVCELTGRLVEPGNNKALADALAQVLNSKSLETPRKFVENSANLAQTVESYFEHYGTDSKVKLC